MHKVYFKTIWLQRNVCSHFYYFCLFYYYCLSLYNNIRGLHYERAKISLSDMYKGKQREKAQECKNLTTCLPVKSYALVSIC